MAIVREELPQAIDSKLIREKLSQLNARLKASDKKTKKKLTELQQEHLPRLESYENQLKTLENRNSYSKTDPDATFMRMIKLRKLKSTVEKLSPSHERAPAERRYLLSK